MSELSPVVDLPYVLAYVRRTIRSLEARDYAIAGTGQVDTGGVAIRRRPCSAGPDGDSVLTDDDGHVFGSVYRTDDGFAGGRWASHGPAAWSPGHPTRESAEDVQIAAHLSNSLQATYTVHCDNVGDSLHWELVEEGATRVEALSLIDLGVRAREIEATYRTTGVTGLAYRVTVACRGRETTAYTPFSDPLAGTDHYKVITVGDDPVR